MLSYSQSGVKPAIDAQPFSTAVAKLGKTLRWSFLDAVQERDRPDRWTVRLQTFRRVGCQETAEGYTVTVHAKSLDSFDAFQAAVLRKHGITLARPPWASQSTWLNHLSN